MFLSAALSITQWALVDEFAPGDDVEGAMFQ